MASPELESLYQDIIIDAAKARHGYRAHLEPVPTGPSTTATATVAHADHCASSHQYNPTCGDEITLLVELDDAHQHIVEVTWEGQGCSISQASASLLTDLIVGKSVDEARTMIDEFRDVMRSRGKKELDIEVFEDAAALSGTSKFLARVKCAMLGWVALEDALLKLS